MTNFNQQTEIFKESRILSIFFLGFSSGLPFLLTLATLHVWLSEGGINKTTIGLFVLITLPYSLKFLWAPFVDHLKIPHLTKIFGQRRGWMLISQFFVIISLLALGMTNPHTNITLTAVAGVMVAFSSATQDIAFEAYRVEILKSHEIGMGAGASMLGYRMGMWVSGAGALYLASYFSWFTVYAFMACCVSVGMITTLLSPEPTLSREALKITSISQTLLEKIKKSALSLLQRENWQIIVMYIIFYKVGDTILNVMTAPFLLETGFSKLEIAHVAKSFGIGAVILGGCIGSVTLTRRPLIETLLLCSLLQIFSCLMFALQAHIGYNLWMLFLTIGIENLPCGIGTAAFIAYLSSLTSAPYTASHYALLTSIGSLARVSLSFFAGWSADHLEWVDFYLLTAAACTPGFILLLFWAHNFHHSPSSIFNFKAKEA